MLHLSRDGHVPRQLYWLSVHSERQAPIYFIFESGFVSTLLFVEKTEDTVGVLYVSSNATFSRLLKLDNWGYGKSQPAEHPQLGPVVESRVMQYTQGGAERWFADEAAVDYMVVGN